MGADVNRMMAEVLGKETGYCKGKGGTMHIMDLSRGILGANGIVGAGIPIATGSAFSAKVRGTGQVTVAFFGDGASNHGTFHESLNMAAAWNLPVVYICENNLYGVSVDIRKVTRVKSIAMRAQAYGMPGVEVDGNNVLEVYRVAKEAIQKSRRDEGPTLIECKTYRWKGHSSSDSGRGYRNEEEVKEWMQRCPIKSFRDVLLDQKVASEKELSDIEEACSNMIKGAAEFAIQSPYPPEQAAYEDVFLEGGANSDL
jgi:pyruvate dehydrogenase E1 component alpha subunit